MGSSLAAFTAGYNPAKRPTAEQTTMPINTQSQGTTKLVCRNRPTTFPTITPKMIPKTAPMRLIKMDSNKNWARMLLLFPPIAFINPISRVRSLTATSIIFIKPIAAPIKVIKPIKAAAVVIEPSALLKTSAMVSLLKI